MLHWGAGRRFVRWAPSETPIVATDADAIILVSAMAPRPNAARQTLINNLIVALKGGANPTWAKLDLLYVLAAHDEQAAKLNWKNPTGAFNITAVNSPAYVIDRGYTGGGTTRLDTGFNPVTSGGLLAQDSAHIGFWGNVASALHTGISIAGGASGTNLYIQPRVDANARARINVTALTIALASADDAAHFIGTRRDAGNQIFFRNGVTTTGAHPSTALNSGNIAILSYLNGTGPYLGQVSVAHAGSSLLDADMTALNAALATYRTGVGL